MRACRLGNRLCNWHLDAGTFACIFCLGSFVAATAAHCALTSADCLTALMVLRVLDEWRRVLRQPA